MPPFSRNSRKANSENLRIKVLKILHQMSCGRKFSTAAMEEGRWQGLLCLSLLRACEGFLSAPKLILRSWPLSR